VHVISGSDDTSIRYWDTATDTCIGLLMGHQDYIRCLAVNPASPDLILSGSYDHTVRVWDLRTGTTVRTLDHGSPVESLLVFPSGGTSLTAGGNYIKTWDVLNTGRLYYGFSNHQKTITSMTFDGSCQRILSGGLDCLVKTYDIMDYSVIHSITYPALYSRWACL
jgi:U3 small nucleolar RNA-associated protein 15